MNIKLIITLIAIVFCLAIAIDVYPSIKADIEAVEGLREYLR